MACPTTYNGGSPNCALAPHAVSNSWGGKINDPFFDISRAWNAADIVPIFANGNNGSSCSTSVSPADTAKIVIAVRATTSTDAIASFSSHGPGPNNRQKPDVSAPGQNIRSAGIASDTGYTNMSGTSMACPHAAGVVALLKGKNLLSSTGYIKAILQSTADQSLLFDGQVCASISDNQFPNYKYGYGQINALKAVQTQSN